MLKQTSSPSSSIQKDFFSAVANGDLEQLKKCIEEGIDPTAKDNHAIYWACRSGHTKMVEYLLTFPNIDPAIWDNGPLRWAARNGHLEIVFILLQQRDRGIDPSALDNYAIAWADVGGHDNVVNLLLLFLETNGECLKEIEKSSEPIKSSPTIYQHDNIQARLTASVNYALSLNSIGRMNIYEDIIKTHGWAIESTFRYKMQGKWTKLNPNGEYNSLAWLYLHMTNGSEKNKLYADKKWYLHYQNSDKFTIKLGDAFLKKLSGLLQLPLVLKGKNNLLSVLLNSIHLEKSRTGFCCQLASAVFVYLWKRNKFIHKIEYVSFKNDRHSFLLVNRKDDSKLDNSDTWDAWIVDAWGNKDFQVYHSSEYQTRMKRNMAAFYEQNIEIIKAYNNFYQEKQSCNRTMLNEHISSFGIGPTFPLDKSEYESIDVKLFAEINPQESPFPEEFYKKMIAHLSLDDEGFYEDINTLYAKERESHKQGHQECLIELQSKVTPLKPKVNVGQCDNEKKIPAQETAPYSISQLPTCWSKAKTITPQNDDKHSITVVQQHRESQSVKKP